MTKPKGTTHAEFNNNPGNIKGWTTAGTKLDYLKTLDEAGIKYSKGSKAADGGYFIKFETSNDGLEAANIWWPTVKSWSTYKDTTLNEALAKYSGNGYTAESLGLNIDGDTPLSEIGDAEFESIMTAQMRKEDPKYFEKHVESKFSLTGGAPRTISFQGEDFVVWDQDGERKILRKSVYDEEMAKGHTGNIQNHPMTKEFTLTDEEVQARIDDGSMSYDAESEMNKLQGIAEIQERDIEDIQEKVVEASKDVGFYPEDAPFPTPDEPKEPYQDELVDLMQEDEPLDVVEEEIEPVTLTEEELDLGEEEFLPDDHPQFVEDTVNIINEQKEGFKRQFKTGLTTNALISAAIGTAALTKATKPIEHEDMPRLSEAFMDYLTENRKLAERGFSPAEEAKAREDINTTYRLGIENIVRGTAGDRAKFLAMSGSVDATRNRALLDFAAKDAQMNRINREQYGKTLTYKEEYDRENQLTLRNEKMKEQITNKEMGAQVAAEAFGNMMDEISYQKNYGPGSYNYMVKSERLARMYNINPDGTPIGEGEPLGASREDRNIFKKTKNFLKEGLHLNRNAGNVSAANESLHEENAQEILNTQQDKENALDYEVTGGDNNLMVDKSDTQTAEESKRGLLHLMGLKRTNKGLIN